MRFVWFWTFWHWSKESFRSGALLRSPLEGIGGHWDEWFRHEASENDLQAITETGRTESAQRQFIAWLHLHWSREANRSGNRTVPRFVLGQLAHVAPFSEWCAFGEYRGSHGSGGISAIVLNADSPGKAEDVRLVEGLALPLDSGERIVSEGFHADAADLETPRRAALGQLSGKGLLNFLLLWAVVGERPHPYWLKVILTLGWAAVGGLLLYLVVGPEPGASLVPFAATLAGLWIVLLLVALSATVREIFRAWRLGRRWTDNLERFEIRLRMDGGLTLRGGSAGLAFCLNTMLSLYSANPFVARRSWLWHQIFRRLKNESPLWAASGVVTADGKIKAVVIEPKIRACAQQGITRHLLAPKQRDAAQRFVERMLQSMPLPAHQGAPARSAITPTRFGFAAENRKLISHRCASVAQALMAIGGLHNSWQKSVGFLALLTSVAMFWALPDLRSILLPPPAPNVVAPSSPSPYHLWVSLDTAQPDRFQVVLESSFWANRRASIARYSGANASVRAEILLHRLGGQDASDGEDGTVWIERRRHFLTREFAPGERVGRYSISYLNRLAQ